MYTSTIDLRFLLIHAVVYEYLLLEQTIQIRQWFAALTSCFFFFLAHFSNIFCRQIVGQSLYVSVCVHVSLSVDCKGSIHTKAPRRQNGTVEAHAWLLHVQGVLQVLSSAMVFLCQFSESSTLFQHYSGQFPWPTWPTAKFNATQSCNWKPCFSTRDGQLKLHIPHYQES